MPPETAAVAAALADVVATYGRKRLELEFRLGHRAGTGAFVPGVPRDAWAALKAALDASAESAGSQLGLPAFTDDTEQIHHEAKYVVGSRRWIHKRRLRDVDVDVPDQPWTCRASMSLEVADPPTQQRPADSKFERHKRRWSYPYRCWSIDLTEVASNLPHQLDNDGKSYEVEIELVDTGELFARPMPELAEWGMRLAADMCALMRADVR